MKLVIDSNRLAEMAVAHHCSGLESARRITQRMIIQTGGRVKEMRILEEALRRAGMDMVRDTAFKEELKATLEIEHAKHSYIPKIVCLCGSTRFWKTFQDVGLRESLSGNVVLSIGAASATDEEHFGHLSEVERTDIKEKLDLLHLRKIDLCDEVVILNVGGYIGESTRNEIDYATVQGKPIRYLETGHDGQSSSAIN